MQLSEKFKNGLLTVQLFFKEAFNRITWYKKRLVGNQYLQGLPFYGIRACNSLSEYLNRKIACLGIALEITFLRLYGTPDLFENIISRFGKRN